MNLSREFVARHAQVHPRLFSVPACSGCEGSSTRALLVAALKFSWASSSSGARRSRWVRATARSPHSRANPMRPVTLSQFPFLIKIARAAQAIGG